MVSRGRPKKFDEAIKMTTLNLNPDDLKEMQGYLDSSQSVSEEIRKMIKTFNEDRKKEEALLKGLLLIPATEQAHKELEIPTLTSSKAEINTFINSKKYDKKTLLLVKENCLMAHNVAKSRLNEAIKTEKSARLM